MRDPTGVPMSILARAFPAGSLIATIARQGVRTLLVRVASLALLFGVQALLARLLGVAQFGVFVVALAVMGVLQMFARQGFEVAASRFVGAYLGRREWGLVRGFIRVALLAVSVGSAVFAVCLAVVAAWRGYSMEDGMMASLWLAAAILPIASVLQIESAVVRGLGHTAVSDVPMWIVHPVALAAGVALAILAAEAERRATTALSVYLAVTSGTLLLQHVVMRRLLPRPVKTAAAEYRWHEWMTAAPAMMLFAGSAMLLSQVNTIILGAMAPAAEAAIFNIAGRIAGVMQLITFCFIGAVGPVAARLYAEQRLDELARIIETATRWVFAATAVAVAVLVLAGRPMLAIFGTEFEAGYGSLLVLAAGQTVWAATVPAGVLLNMTGHHNVSAKILMLAAVVNVVLCVALVPEYGSMGAAVATAVAIVLWNGAMAWSAYRRVGIRACVTFWPAAG